MPGPFESLFVVTEEEARRLSTRVLHDGTVTDEPSELARRAADYFSGLIVKAGGPYIGPFMALLIKARSHKYIRRVPYTDKHGKRRYRYIYQHKIRADAAGKEYVEGVATHEHIVVGAKFSDKSHGHEGHYEITAVEGNTVTVRHDETGEVEKVSRDELRARLRQVHTEGYKQAKQRLIEKRRKEVRESMMVFGQLLRQYRTQPTQANKRKLDAQRKRVERLARAAGTTLEGAMANPDIVPANVRITTARSLHATMVAMHSVLQTDASPDQINKILGPLKEYARALGITETSPKGIALAAAKEIKLDTPKELHESFPTWFPAPSPAAPEPPPTAEPAAPEPPPAADAKMTKKRVVALFDGVREAGKSYAPYAPTEHEERILRAVTLFTAGNVQTVRDPAKYDKEKATDNINAGMPGGVPSQSVAPTKKNYADAHRVLKALAGRKPPDGAVKSTIYRGMALSQAASDALVAGASLDLSVVSSFSHSRDVAHGFSGAKPAKGKPVSVLITMRNPKKGTHLNGLSGYKNEDEIVTGGKVRVLERTYKPGGFYESPRLEIVVEHI